VGKENQDWKMRHKIALIEMQDRKTRHTTAACHARNKLGFGKVLRLQITWNFKKMTGW